MFQFLPAILSLTLVVGGVAMLAQVVRARRAAAIEQHVALVGPAAAPLQPSTGGDEPFLRFSVAGIHDADLAVITRIAKRVGISPRHAPLVFAASRLAAGAILGFATPFLLHRFATSGPLAGAVVIGFAPIMALVGWAGPFHLVRNAALRRAEAVTEALPEALELLVVCVEAGLSLEDGLDRITRELVRSQPLLAEELALTSADLKVLPDRDQALEKLAQRVNTSTMQSVVTTLSQTLRYGTPLTQALRTAATELRNEFFLAIEERANRMPTLMTIPMMLFIMPTIFIVIGGSAVLQLLDAFNR